MKGHQALLIVDVQKDFCCGGSLAVPGGDEIVPVLNGYIAEFSRRNLPVFASRDWHPAETAHFTAQGGMWPPHCVQDTEGAEFHSDLALSGHTVVLSKGMDPGADGYTAFESADSSGRDFESVLRSRGIDTLFIGGLATDYCVKHSVVDALTRGFTVYLLRDAIRGVEPKSTKKAIEEMTAAGANTVKRADIRDLLV
jgi:nicotinamidase/pyrazinamidase